MRETVFNLTYAGKLLQDAFRTLVFKLATTLLNQERLYSPPSLFLLWLGPGLAGWFLSLILALPLFLALRTAGENLPTNALLFALAVNVAIHATPEQSETKAFRNEVRRTAGRGSHPTMLIGIADIALYLQSTRDLTLRLLLALTSAVLLPATIATAIVK